MIFPPSVNTQQSTISKVCGPSRGRILPRKKRINFLYSAGDGFVPVCFVLQLVFFLYLGSGACVFLIQKFKGVAFFLSPAWDSPFKGSAPLSWQPRART